MIEQTLAAIGTVRQSEPTVSWTKSDDSWLLLQTAVSSLCKNIKTDPK